MSYNKTTIVGNLTRDPELRYTPKGTAVLKLGLAVNRTWTAEGGEKKESVTFIDCTAWSRTAEVIDEFFAKGDEILIEGRLEQESWIDKETQDKRSKLVVVVESFTFTNGRKSGRGGKAAPAPPAVAATATPEKEHDDVPF
jgi:single-strand DNA-binding protein